VQGSCLQCAGETTGDTNAKPALCRQHFILQVNIMSIMKRNFQGWPNCHAISNGLIELILTEDIGPRIMFAGFSGGENFLAVFPESAGQTGGDQWVPFGGHRLWHAPEHEVRTYQPDNSPIAVERLSEFSARGSAHEPATGLDKEMEIVMSPDQPLVKVIHRLRNTNLWSIPLAPWSLSMMAPGGAVVLPQPPRAPHIGNLLPKNSLSLWSYTDMSDPRWTWGRKYILLRQDPKAEIPQKIGMLIPDAWAAYARHNEVLVTFFSYDPLVRYPDGNCNFETFTNNAMLEVESLGPMMQLEPGQTVEHVEQWYFGRNVAMPRNDAEVDEAVLPVVEKGKALLGRD